MNAANTSNDTLDNLAFIWLLVIAFGISWLWSRWQRHQLAKIKVDAPLLLTLYTAGLSLSKVSAGSLSGLHYDLVVTEPYTPPTTSSIQMYQYADSSSLAGAAGAAALEAGGSLADMAFTGKLLLTLELPTRSEVHITCFGAPEKLRRKYDTLAKASGLTAASLEGDFPDYFCLYCTEDKEIELREVLDPATMAFLVDYCQREDWELFENTLYFSQTNLAKPATIEDGKDDKSLVGDAEEFVTKILPILQRMGSVQTTVQPTP